MVLVVNSEDQHKASRIFGQRNMSGQRIWNFQKELYKKNSSIAWAADFHDEINGNVT